MCEEKDIRSLMELGGIKNEKQVLIIGILDVFAKKKTATLTILSCLQVDNLHARFLILQRKKSRHRNVRFLSGAAQGDDLQFLLLYEDDVFEVLLSCQYLCQNYAGSLRIYLTEVRNDDTGSRVAREAD